MVALNKIALMLKKKCKSNDLFEIIMRICKKKHFNRTLFAFVNSEKDYVVKHNSFILICKTITCENVFVGKGKSMKDKVSVFLKGNRTKIKKLCGSV